MSGTTKRRAALFGGLGMLAAAALNGCSSAPSSPAAGASPVPGTKSPQVAISDSSAIHVARAVHVDSRLLDLTLATPALTKPVHVNVLLPAGYAQHPERHYPVIYLLHGGSAGPNTGTEYREWSQAGGAAQITAGVPVIVVMPQADSGGWYTNWDNGGKGGQPEWETFHIHQLVPFVDGNYRTIPSRTGRALIGLSMGGYGAMEYAARYPDLFAAAASFSGAVDIANPPALLAPISTQIIAAMAAGDGGQPDSIFGSFADDEINWRGHDPADLATNLRDTKLFLYTGNGEPGPLDPPGTSASRSASASAAFSAATLEKVVHLATVSFDHQLTAEKVPYFIDDYGPGTHSWPYWQRDLRDVLPRVMSAFTHPSPSPATISYTTADPSYARWGWSVRMHRPAAEFSTLSDAGPKGFELSGSGSGTVTSPALYRPGSRHTVTITGTGVSARQSLRADSQGRIAVTVTLGPGNPFPQYSAAARPAGTHRFNTFVRVA